VQKGQATKWVGWLVRLQPSARRLGVALDGDWLVRRVDEHAIVIMHIATEAVAVIGFDGIHAFFSDPGRDSGDQKHGWLQLNVEIEVTSEGRVNVIPLPPPRASDNRTATKPLKEATRSLAARQYGSLWLNARAALGYLLVAGDATTQDVLRHLSVLGLGGEGDNLLALIAQATQLVMRAEVETKETRLLGYRGRYKVNPTFREALADLVARDTEITGHLLRS